MVCQGSCTAHKCGRGVGCEGHKQAHLASLVLHEHTGFNCHAGFTANGDCASPSLCTWADSGSAEVCYRKLLAERGRGSTPAEQSVMLQPCISIVS